MTRAEILSFAIFDTGAEIDGLKFGPLSQPALVILKRRKNSFFADSTRDQDEHEAVGEILFVISRSKEERQAMFRDSAEEWDLKVGEFIAGLEDNTLPKFRDEYLGPALQALALAMVESEAPGKPAQNPATSHFSPKDRDVSDSTGSPPALASKNRSGGSQRVPSSNSSTPKQSATDRASAGSTGRKRTPKKSKNSKISRIKK